MKTLHLTFLATAAILLNSVCFAGALIINFDTDAYGNPINAPSYFFQTSSLTELYAPLGVHFNGLSDGEGGEILNDSGAAPGSFGILALSGHNFLAFSSTGPAGPEIVTFDTLMSSVSIFASAGNAYYGSFTMQAFSSEGVQVDTDTVIVPYGQYGELNVSSPNGIQYVVLSEYYSVPGWVFDNLTATPVPEPKLLSLFFSVLPSCCCFAVA
jgi:hypothetical protein